MIRVLLHTRDNNRQTRDNITKAKEEEKLKRAREKERERNRKKM